MIIGSGSPFFDFHLRRPLGTDLRPILSPSWAHLGPILGPSWAILGPSWVHLGPSWALSWAILGPHWVISSVQRDIFNHELAIIKPLLSIICCVTYPRASLPEHGQAECANRLNKSQAAELHKCLRENTRLKYDKTSY